MRRLSLDDILSEGKKVYVKNNALKTHLFLVVEMKDKSGKSRSFKIPPINSPICVSDQFSPETILESTDLREMLQKQVIILIEPETAEKELQTKDSQEELKAFSMSVYSDNAPDNAVRDSVEKLKIKSDPSVTSADALLQNSIASEDVKPRIKGLIASFQSKEKSSKDTLIHLRRLKETLTESDLTYVISMCKTETSIREFAEEALSQLAATPAEQVTSGN